jgi:PAS domain S-box-containing protein/putative nucleotidyltransferase with HDIG domain
MLQSTAADITYPDDIGHDARQVEQLIDAGFGGYLSEKRYVRPDGQVVWAALTIVQLPRNGSGNSARHLTLVEDITEKRAARAALLRSEAHTRAVVENAPVVLWAIDREGTFTLSVGKALAGIGLRPDEVVGQSVFDLYRDYPVVIDGVRASLAGETRSWELDLGDVVFDSRTEPMCDEAGEVVGVIGIAVDVTERRTAETDRVRTAAALRRTLASAVAALGSTISSRDPYTAGHQERVTKLAIAIAVKLGLDEAAIETLRFAGELHDIGKISVPTEILNKPGRLSAAEFALIKHHAAAGYEIVREIEFDQPIADIVHQHHERLDGSGYPRGLTGDETLLEAKVLAVADVVEAMASHRPYRPARGIDAALTEIEARRGSLYDPAVADACLELFRTDGFLLD